MDLVTPPPRRPVLLATLVVQMENFQRAAVSAGSNTRLRGNEQMSKLLQVLIPKLHMRALGLVTPEVSFDYLEIYG